jgi:hypothetical protein
MHQCALGVCVCVCVCVCDAFLLVVHVVLVSKITAGFD